MARFPSSEMGVVELAEQMINGLTEFPDDFPSCEAAGLTAILADYKNSKDAFDTAEGQVKVKVESKASALEVLTTTMKDYLKKAETDVTAQPEKLGEIGWGTRAQPVPLQPPNFPGNLRVVAEGQGTLAIVWDKPESGGAVWNYLVERRQQLQAGGEFGQWTLAATVYNCEANLTEQPADVKLEYRVKASNTAGESAPTDSITVTLP